MLLPFLYDENNDDDVIIGLETVRRETVGVVGTRNVGICVHTVFNYRERLSINLWLVVTVRVATVVSRIGSCARSTAATTGAWPNCRHDRQPRRPFFTFHCNVRCIVWRHVWNDRYIVIIKKKKKNTHSVRLLRSDVKSLLNINGTTSWIRERVPSALSSSRESPPYPDLPVFLSFLPFVESIDDVDLTFCIAAWPYLIVKEYVTHTNAQFYKYKYYATSTFCITTIIHKFICYR